MTEGGRQGGELVFGVFICCELMSTNEKEKVLMHTRNGAKGAHANI